MIFDKLKAYENRLNNIQQQLHQNLIIQRVQSPELRDVQWGAHLNIEKAFMCYLSALVIQGILSGLGNWVLYKTNGKAIGYAYLATLLSFPGYMIGIKTEELSRYLCVKTKNAITPGLNHFLTHNHARPNIEMASLMAAHDDADRMALYELRL